MPPEIVVRPPSPSDEPAILDLLRASFGMRALVDDPEFWRWKHASSPFGDSPALVAESGGRLVGLRTLMPWCWQSGTAEAPSFRAVDTVTHPDWRGRSVFRELTLAMLRNLREADTGWGEAARFVFNTPNRKSLPGYLKMGWRVVGRVPVWLAGSPLSLARAAVRPGPTSDLARALPEARLDDLFGDEPRLQSFLDRWNGETRLHTPRSTTYLAWRYRNVPRLRYQARWELHDDRGAILVFRRKSRRGLEELTLSEILVTGGNPGIEIAVRLLGELRADLEPEVVTAVAAPGTPEAAALRRSGLFRMPGGPVVVVRPLTALHGLPDPLERESWRWSLGDLEVF